METHYLNDLIEENKNDPLKSKIINLAYKNALFYVNSQLEGEKYPEVKGIYFDDTLKELLDAYHLPVEDIYWKIKGASTTAINIIDDEIKETLQPYSDMGIKIIDESVLRTYHFGKYNPEPDDVEPYEKLCKSFSDKIDAICDDIITSIADELNDYYDSLKQKKKKNKIGDSLL